jgi:hypothetical protein
MSLPCSRAIREREVMLRAMPSRAVSTSFERIDPGPAAHLPAVRGEFFGFGDRQRGAVVEQDGAIEQGES